MGVGVCMKDSVCEWGCVRVCEWGWGVKVCEDEWCLRECVSRLGRGGGKRDEVQENRSGDD